jgi:hypothetical protein
MAGLANLLRQNRDAASAELGRLAGSDVSVTIGVAQLASPQAPLRFSLYRGRRRSALASVVISGEGRERTVLVEGAGAISSVRATTEQLRDALGHLVDDIAATGDYESAAALNRWLG